MPFTAAAGPHSWLTVCVSHSMDDIAAEDQPLIGCAIQQAAQNGNAEALHLLAVMYIGGDGVGKDAG